MKKTVWRLDEKEVSENTSTSSHNGRGGGSISRQSRAANETDLTMTLTHRPTQVEIKGEISTGRYTRKMLLKLKAQLRAQLFVELEQKVARHLRVPGFNYTRRITSNDINKFNFRELRLTHKLF